MNMKDQVVLVTGGAGGIAHATCHRLAKEGAKVAIADLNIEAANKLADEIRAQGVEAIAIKVDVTSLDDTDRMAQTVLDKFGRIDILINMAGGAIPGIMGPFAQSTKEGWDRTIGLNLYGTLTCTRSVVNHMIARKKGKIVNMASVSGMVGQATTADYAACKGGIIAFTKSLAKELAPYAINVNCVSPSFTGTPRVLSMSKEFLQRQIDMIHLHRYAKPEEVANVIVFLASDEADFVTGSNYVVDGGITLSY
ncbi:MAG: SDR family NAD(P)-dependent oxidoreductase [Dehalococcoidales bacterium]